MEVWGHSSSSFEHSKDSIVSPCRIEVGVQIFFNPVVLEVGEKDHLGMSFEVVILVVHFRCRNLVWYLGSAILWCRNLQFAQGSYISPDGSDSFVRRISVDKPLTTLGRNATDVRVVGFPRIITQSHGASAQAPKGCGWGFHFGSVSFFSSIGDLSGNAVHNSFICACRAEDISLQNCSVLVLCAAGTCEFLM